MMHVVPVRTPYTDYVVHSPPPSRGVQYHKSPEMSHLDEEMVRNGTLVTAVLEVAECLQVELPASRPSSSDGRWLPKKYLTPVPEWTPIAVREFTGTVHPVIVDLSTEDVNSLKVKVQAVTGTVPDAQCLVVEGGDGKPVEDGTQKLRYCAGLESGALVHMAMQDEEQARVRRAEREAEQAVWIADLMAHSCSCCHELCWRPGQSPVGSVVKHEGRVGVIVQIFGEAGDVYSWGDSNDHFGYDVHAGSENTVRLRWEDDDRPDQYMASTLHIALAELRPANQDEANAPWVAAWKAKVAREWWRGLVGSVVIGVLGILAFVYFAVWDMEFP